MPLAMNATQSLCPECKALVPADVVEDEGRVVMVKRCPEHGEHRALTCSDAEWYRWSRKFIKPGRAPLFHATQSEAGAPMTAASAPSTSNTRA